MNVQQSLQPDLRAGLQPGLPLDEPMPPWRMLFDPRGRISRRSFWLWGVLALIAAGTFAHALLGIARVRRETAEHIVNVLLLWPAIATSAKRWHDRGKSAWWVLVVLVPVLGWLWALVENGFLRGQPGTNRFGADPLDVSTDR
jgi:uncharacterized membrane protein YhaH (DUF805 family)